MIPDYFTFIRYQDKRTLPVIYLVTLTLLGFYWKNSGFSLSVKDIGCVSAILALILYAFIADLRAYWAYKIVVKNVDLSCFVDQDPKRADRVIYAPLVVVPFAMLLAGGLTGAVLLLTPPAIALTVLAVTAPLLIWGLFALLRPRYIRQVFVAPRDTLRYRRLSHYLALPVLMSLLMTLLTIAPLRHREAFDLYGHYFTLKAIITMLVLCAVVLAINLLSLRFTRRYIFLGHLFMNEIDLLFSSATPLRTLYEKPLWLRLLLLLAVEFVWLALTGLIATLLGWNLWFEVYFLLCYLPCLAYYALHAWWKWHNDFMMSCDMYLRWGEISRQNALW